jgi:hypothetical protein
MSAKVSTFRSNAPKFPTQHCFWKVSRLRFICPYGKTNMLMKMSMEHWLDDTDTGIPTYSLKNLSQ